jgi:hypothetical protein
MKQDAPLTTQIPKVAIIIKLQGKVKRSKIKVPIERSHHKEHACEI